MVTDFDKISDIITKNGVVGFIIEDERYYDFDCLVRFLNDNKLINKISKIKYGLERIGFEVKILLDQIGDQIEDNQKYIDVDFYLTNNKDKIAKDISELEDMPNDDTYYEACILVAENVYGLNYATACEISDIIQNEYLRGY